MKRRLLVKSLGLFLFLFWQGSSAGQGPADPIGERFQGEVLRYDIGFWIFRRIGEGTATFRSLGNGRYEAFHEGRTLGFVGWFTHHRRDVYRSLMGTMNGGTRLIPYRFEEDVIIGRQVRKRITIFDYSGRNVIIETQEGGKINRAEAEIPWGVIYDDPLTAFYNFRFGVYGKVEPGKEFFIPTAPSKGRQPIHLTVAPKEEEERRRAAETEKEGKDLLIRVHLDRELVGSLAGEVEVWFSQDIIPTAGVAKDVFFYGDIVGKLTYRGFPHSQGKSERQINEEKRVK